MTCENLCTASECEQLSLRITELEIQIEELTNIVSFHLNQDVYTGHNYDPNLDLFLSLNDSILDVQASLDGNSSSDSVDLSELLITDFDIEIIPETENNYLFRMQINNVIEEVVFSFEEPEVTIDVSELNPGEYGVSLTVGTQQAQDNFLIGSVIDSVNIDVFELGNNQYGLSLTVNDLEAQDNFSIDNHVVSNLAIDGVYQNDYLTLTVADGESFDTAQIFLDASTTINNNDGGGGSEDVSCDQTEQTVIDCCAELLAAIGDLSNQVAESQNVITTEIDNTEILLNNEIQKVEDYLTIEIKGEVETEFLCEFELDQNNDVIPTYAVSQSEKTNIDSFGIAGLKQYLEIIATNLKTLHTDTCKSVDPISSISYGDLYQYCDTSQIRREDFSDDEIGEEEYNFAVQEYLRNLLLNSKYGNLIAGVEANDTATLLTAPNNWIAPIISDFSLIQSKINNDSICDIELEAPDVVAIVASEKDIHRVKDKVLILHFVTLDNYPRRANGSGYRQIQIPDAKDSYDWATNFENLRWIQGNQYGEMQFNEPWVSVSGWFRDEAAGNAYFDQILNLTNATEKNRKFPTHSNPETAIPIRETRPYRAFIKSINPQGQAICHAKYVPVINNNNNGN